MGRPRGGCWGGRVVLANARVDVGDGNDVVGNVDHIGEAGIATGRVDVAVPGMCAARLLPTGKAIIRRWQQKADAVIARQRRGQRINAAGVWGGAGAHLRFTHVPLLDGHALYSLLASILPPVVVDAVPVAMRGRPRRPTVFPCATLFRSNARVDVGDGNDVVGNVDHVGEAGIAIGRAACRERGEISAGGGSRWKAAMRRGERRAGAVTCAEGEGARSGGAGCEGVGCAAAQ